MFENQRFTLKPEHLTLLRRAYIGWEDCEFGAPAIDCKRPYGNSSVYRDIAEILGITPADADEEEFSEEQEAYMRRLHEETQTALQIILSTGTMVPGVYEAPAYSRDWAQVAASTGAK